MTKARELREKSADDLRQILNDLRKEHFNLRMQQGSDQLSRPSQMKTVRRDIARVKMVMHETAAGKAE